MSQLRAFRPDSAPLYDAAMPITVREVIAKYLQSSEVNQTHGVEAFAERTRVLCRFADAQTEGRTIGEMPVAECMPHFLSDWIEDHPFWKAPSTRKSKANQINACFNWARRGRRITDNPFSEVNYDESPPRQPMPDDVLDDFLCHSNKAFERALRFLRLSGCRLSDLCRMTWEDIEWERGLVVLWVHKTIKKKRKPKTIVLVPEAVAFLRDMEKNHYAPGVVFRNNKGTAWTRGSLGLQLRRMKERFGAKCTATLHGIRHQAGTTAIREGGDLKYVSLMLGHSSTQITEKYYVHVDGDYEAIREAAQLAQKKTK